MAFISIITLSSGWPRNKKLVTRSSAKVEYRTLALGSIEMVWLHSLLTGLHIKTTHLPIFFVDNITAKHLATNLMMHAHMKHVEINFHFIHDLIKKNSMLDLSLQMSREHTYSLCN